MKGLLRNISLWDSVDWLSCNINVKCLIEIFVRLYFLLIISEFVHGRAKSKFCLQHYKSPSEIFLFIYFQNLVNVYWFIGSTFYSI